MINIIKIKKLDIKLFFILLFYLLMILFDFRDGYISGDEIYFLNSTPGDDPDLRYKAWMTYIQVTASIFINTPIIINLIITIILMRMLNTKRIFSNLVTIAFFLIPTVFYFLLTYLRDPIFMIFSFVTLIQLTCHENLSWSRQIAIWSGIAIMFILRPYYGLIYASALLLSHKYLSKYLTLILFLIFTIYITAAVLIFLNHDLFNMYSDFFSEGHLREKSMVGVISIPQSKFSADSAALNILLSPLYFWFIPASGFGFNYDLLLFIENFFILILFVFSILRRKTERLKIDRAFRMSWIVLTFSLFVAASTVNHQDSYRYRLIFLPFLMYVALANKTPNRYSNNDKNLIL